MQLHFDQIFKDFPTIFQQDVYVLFVDIQYRIRKIWRI